MNDTEKRKIVITGASSEIGLAIATKLGKSGDSLVLQYNSNKEKLEAFQNSFDGEVILIKSNFNDAEQRNMFVCEVEDCDILINAAALTKTDLLVNLKSCDISKMIQINIMATIEFCQAVIPSMMRKRKGVIINLSSIAAQKGNRGQSVYAGTKGFIESFTKSTATECAKKGVRINCVAPGGIEAGSLTSLLSYAKEEVMNSISMAKTGKPADVANLVNFLCSDEASYITGQTFTVDGGFMRGL